MVLFGNQAREEKVGQVLTFGTFVMKKHMQEFVEQTSVQREKEVEVLSSEEKEKIYDSMEQEIEKLKRELMAA